MSYQENGSLDILITTSDHVTWPLEYLPFSVNLCILFENCHVKKGNEIFGQELISLFHNKTSGDILTRWVNSSTLLCRPQTSNFTFTALYEHITGSTKSFQNKKTIYIYSQNHAEVLNHSNPIQNHLLLLYLENITVSAYTSTCKLD